MLLGSSADVFDAGADFDSNTNGYANAPPVLDFAKVTVLITPATQALSFASVEPTAVEEITLPFAATLILALTVPPTFDRSPHAVILAFTLAIPAVIVARSRSPATGPPV